VAHRIRAQFANVRVLGNVAARAAVVVLAHGPARRWLEQPSWGQAEPAPDCPALAIEPGEIRLPGCPFQVATPSGGDSLFITLQRAGGNQRSPGAVAVLRREGAAFRLERRIELTAAAWGMTWLRDESLLAVANSHGVVLIDARAARQPQSDPIAAMVHYGRDLYTTQVLASTDGRWLFASDEHNSTVSIVDVDRALSGAGPEALACQLPVDVAPVGMSLAPDGRRLYVTCEMARIAAPELANWLIYAATLRGRLRRAGVLGTIDVAAALQNPAGAVIGRAVAGGHPVRTQLSSDGRVAWVTARASNQLLAFGVADSDGPQPLAAVPVGPAPVGLALIEELGVVLVANSNRFASTRGAETLSVIDCQRALAGRPALLGNIRVGSFPREVVADDRNRVVYVTNFDSSSVSVIPYEFLGRAIDSARAEPEG
jgi:hypothetical protein